MPSLLLMRQVHSEDGPPLPLGGQLYRLLQLQVLPEHAFLHSHHYHLCCYHFWTTVPRRHGGKYCSQLHLLLHLNFLHPRCHSRHHNNRVFLVPCVSDHLPVYYHRVLWEKFLQEQSPWEWEVPLWSGHLQKFLDHSGDQCSSLVYSHLRAHWRQRHSVQNKRKWKYAKWILNN